MKVYASKFFYIRIWVREIEREVHIHSFIRMTSMTEGGFRLSPRSAQVLHHSLYDFWQAGQFFQGFALLALCLLLVQLLIQQMQVLPLASMIFGMLCHAGLTRGFTVLCCSVLMQASGHWQREPRQGSAANSQIFKLFGCA